MLFRFKLLIAVLIGFNLTIALNAQKPIRPIETVVVGNYSIAVYNFKGFEEIVQASKETDSLYVFNFWATWCAPCIKELPYFEQIGEGFAPKKVKIVLVNLDSKSKIKTQLILFLQQKQIQSQVIVLSEPDANSWIDKVSKTWSGSIPATLLIQNEKRAFYEKSFTYDELNSLITQFLKQ